MIVLSVGGSPTVKKIYSLLIMALEDRKETITGKALFLLDTDHKYSAFHVSDTIPSIKIRRLLLSKDMKTINLTKLTDDCVYPPTEIEQALKSDIYLDALKAIYEKGEPLLSFMQSPLKIQSDVSGGVLNLNITEKNDLDSYFELPGKKNEFCNIYVEILEKSEEIKTPLWLIEVVEFLDGQESSL